MRATSHPQAPSTGRPRRATRSWRTRGVAGVGLAVLVALVASGAVPLVDGTAPNADGQAAGRDRRVLVVRGGLGTAGFLQGRSDQDLSDLFNERMGGLARFGALLAGEGYEVTQVEEAPGGTKVDLGAIDLERYGLVVLGSNNAAYGPADALRLAAYVRAGGSILAFADANYGKDWRAAADSDQQLLERLGLTVSQDNGRPQALTPDDVAAPDHPVLRGVDKVDGYGATAFTVSGGAPEARATILATPNTPVRENTGDGTQPGPDREATKADGAVVAVTLGQGRVLATFDRDTFFGTSLAQSGNRTFTLNAVRWLTTGA